MTTESIRQRAVVVTFHCGIPTGFKLDKRVSRQTCEQHGATVESGKFNKRILPVSALKPLQNHIQVSGDYFREHSLPITGEDGRRFLANQHLTTFVAEMKVRGQHFDKLRDDFLAGYADFIEQAKRDLVGLFSEKDYPPAEKMRRKFYWDLGIEPVPAGRDLVCMIGPAELAALREELDKRVAMAARLAQRDLYRRLFEPLAHMVERLSDPVKIFRDTLIENLQSVCELIPVLSLDDDQALASLVDAARKLSMNRADTLREDNRVRADVAARAKELTDHMRKMLGEEESSHAE